MRSLSEAPTYASAIAGILKQGIYPKHLVPWAKSAENVSMQGMCTRSLFLGCRNNSLTVRSLKLNI